MKTKLLALTTAATMAFAAPMFAQSATQGFDMLTGAIYNQFLQMGLPTDGIQDLSVSQVAQIKDIIDGDVPDGQKKSRIKAILDR